MVAEMPTEPGAGLLAGRVAVVTGASRGLGVTIARRLGGEGAAVVLLARSAEKLRALADELGPSSVALRCDVSDPDSVRGAFAQIDERCGRVDLLVNNAAIIGMALLEEATDEAVLDMVATNLVGPMLCTRAAIPLLRAAGGGDVVNISSRSVELARPYLSVYSATKGGLEAFSRTMAAELRPNAIRVSAIRVGPIATAPEVQTKHQASAVTEEWVKRGGPAPESPAPAESVADAIVFIATTRAGARIPVMHLEPS
jgi:meso-butanediol dehydrogenase / (S,S)-butanediol dehydrogenase / diacetyl reductase